VRRVAPAVELPVEPPLEPPRELRRSERPTIPVPRCAVVEGPDESPSMYARIASGSLASTVAHQARPSTALAAVRERAYATTRDLLLGLGSYTRTPIRVCEESALRHAPIDSSHAFLFSLVDGTTTIESIVDASPMALDRVLLALAELVQLGLIAIPA
jgi:hypothetical protein